MTREILQSALASVSQETQEMCALGENRVLTTKKSLCQKKICSGSRRMETNPLTSQDFSVCKLFANICILNHTVHVQQETNKTKTKLLVSWYIQGKTGSFPK